MTVRWKYAIVIGMAGVVLYGCVKSIDTVGPAEKKEIQSRFDHDRHGETMLENRLNCLSCHPQKTALAPLVEKASDDGRRFTCHDCHRNAMFKTVATQRCETCHESASQARPADHYLDWGERHAIFARIDGMQCMSCHDQRSCNDCHIQRDTIQQTVHVRTYLYIHSIEARGDPQKCGSCHQLNFCTDCHVGKGVTF